MKITASILTDITGRKVPGDVADAIDAACQEFNITSVSEQAAFIAQMCIESAGFTRTEENLNYRSAERIAQVFKHSFPTAYSATPFIGSPEKLANKVYAGKLGNGDEASGDGWRYRGMGYKQITGKATQLKCLADLYGDDADTSVFATPSGAARSGAWFWVQNHCGKALSTGGIDAVTRIVNGPAMLGAAERKEAYEKAWNVMKAES